MRILQVRFKNLNSLVGEWAVDLTHPAFTSDGIFAITGPTGAGKSTILDAICLALYGQTPRLGRVTKSGNEIISRQTGECFAEVTFETQAGRYRCHWSQHRARRKPDGELQAPKHEIADADSGEIYESKLRGVADQIVSVTGMDFERFTRSMLLAQGGFAAFLQAAPDERAPILEQITGTGIYSRISIRVHERQREAREKLNNLRAETAGIEILEPEQEQEIEQALAAKRKEEAELTARSAETGKAIAWLSAIAALKQELYTLATEARELQSDIDAFKPDRERLNLASSAAVLDGVYASLTAVRKQQKDDSDALTAEEEAFPELEAAAGKQAAQLNSAEQQSVRIKDELKAVSPILRQVRALDQKLSDRKRAVAEEAALCRKDAARIDADRQARREQREICSKSHETLAAIDGYLDEHAADEWLIGGLAGIEEQISGLLSRQQEILQQEADQAKAVMALKEAARSLADCRARCDKRKRELEEAANRLQQGRGVLSRLLGDRLLREYRAEKERLLREMVFLSKIAELEEYRARLEDGEPCPLCGATGHPYAEGNTPVPDDTETKIDTLTQLIEKAEAQEAAIERFEAAENLARTNLTEAEREVSAAVGEERSVADLLAGMKAGLAKHRAEFDEHKQVISKRLLPLGVAEIPEAEISALLESLRSRLQAWQARVEERAETGKRIAGLDGEVKRLDAVIETQSTALDEKRKRLETLKKELATVGDERSSLYGDKNPDDEERRLNMAVSAAEDAERQARERYAELQQKSNTARARIGSLKMRIDRRAAELASAEAGFSAALAPAGFADEGQFLQARLSAAHRDGLTTRARALDERQTALKARQNDREQRLASEIARALSDESLELLESRLEAYQASLQTLRDLIAGFRHRLSENGAAKARIEARQAVIERQRTACRRWDNLHALIGSGDGRKYRNFAQGLTFEMMIGHANRQLRKMTDRYLLIRDELQPLALNVIDNYQAGEVRSTRNLSGGESFIVSLSLALGLSHMASRNVRVDSLFLDEGFGTLDEEALEIALDTLAGLQQEGKLIGVISHVQALKERIATRIRVVPKSGGRSEIQGVGCSSIGG